VPLNRTVILDAGCGTGNYSQAMFGYVGRIEAVDLNPGMLEVASRKLAQASAEERISFHSGAIDDLPFRDATFGACGKSKMVGEYCPIRGMH
jgi:malonyl-CoA O-methyltransferase